MYLCRQLHIVITNYASIDILSVLNEFIKRKIFDTFIEW